MADEKLVSWLRTLGVTAFDSSNTATETPSNARAQQGVDSAKVSAPTASGSSTSDLIKTKSAEPPPKGGFSAEGKRGMDISTEEGSATGSAEGKIAANDGRGGKSELGGKASAKIDKSGNIDLSLGANQTNLDEKGKGT